MLTKLTLSIEEETIKKAKNFANKSGKSLSVLVATYLEKITGSQDEEISEDFKGLFGSVDLPDDLNEKVTIRQIMTEKHTR